MNKRINITIGLMCVLASLGRMALADSQQTPNFIIIFCDDLGYGDVGCFGSKTIKTPVIDRMADEGMKLTSFYAQTVCGPSRAALMNGC